MTPLTKQERAKLIEQYYRLRDENGRVAATEPNRDRMPIIRQAQDTLRTYFDVLPRVQMSRCPFTGLPLARAFDPWGPDGFWWQDRNQCWTAEPEPPETFRVLRGALNLNGLPPLGGRDKALVGPDVPYVVPRILKMPTMVAVVSSLPMLNGYTAFPIAYYSTIAPDLANLTETWCQNTYSFKNAKAEGLWTITNDAWDFDLKPWVESGRLLWILPGDEQFVAQRGSWEEFPYKDMPGKRLAQCIVRDKLFTSEVPDGSPIDPFE